MVFDSLKQRMGGRDNLTPMQVAQHPLFTAREKIDLLHQIKAEVTGKDVNADDLGFEPEEVDNAIAYVREGVESGVGTETVLKGDY
ncbi:hypothetical protein IC608_09250 [Devosia sp. PTR5]|uniref:Uncharacterized protein n=1 Tax=Devosia oryzisoli TaxID=2774138 RepID=A0A927FSW7_9HYPH|nr:hypothetical protein [Devosia oryzisoli]MBD8065660.1 hypothetical protein [Devosia oryzisoli]